MTDPPAPARDARPAANPLLQIGLYLLCVIVLGAILAPPLYWGGKWLAGLIVSFKQTGTPVLGWFAQKLTIHEFDSYYNRAFLVSALGLLWPFLRWMRISRSSLGLERNPLRIADTLMGIVLAGGLLAAMGIALVQCGAFTRNATFDWDRVVLKAGLPAVAASLLEEWIFRGIFLGVALRAARPWRAILLVSALFSILHLTQAPSVDTTERAERKALADLEISSWPRMAADYTQDPTRNDWIIDDALPQFQPSRITAGSGFAMTAEIFRQNTRPALFVSEFLTLFFIGVILAWARVRTASLWLPIGLHAGWIFMNGLYSGATRTTRALKDGQFDLVLGENRIPLIGEQLKIGLVPLGVLAVTFAATAVWVKMRRRRLPASPSVAGKETR